MFSLNPAFDMADAGTYVLDYLDKDKQIDYQKNLDPTRAGLYRLCEQKEVAITVMKGLGAGKLLSPEFTPFREPLSVTQCIHYALTRPAVASVLLGCSTKEQVLESMQYLNASEEEKDYSQIIKDYQGNMKGSCVYCNHCLPCPAQIDIASVNKYLDIALLDEKNIPPSIKGHYSALKHKAGECTSCANCEERCPFSVPIIKIMQKAAQLLG
jgi:predicted aldo/keto reductase-like oxidoreductase